MRSTTAGLVDELQQILDDSATSMAGSAALSSDADKGAWWRARIALDERVAALLSRVRRGWLGPWRCLLAAPAGRGGGGGGALLEAAAGFVGEHFDFVFGERTLPGIMATQGRAVR